MAGFNVITEAILIASPRVCRRAAARESGYLVTSDNNLLA
jgi:hypothetical protein